MLKNWEVRPTEFKPQACLLLAVSVGKSLRITVTVSSLAT